MLRPRSLSHRTFFFPLHILQGLQKASKLQELPKIFQTLPKLPHLPKTNNHSPNDNHGSKYMGRHPALASGTNRRARAMHTRSRPIRPDPSSAGSGKRQRAMRNVRSEFKYTDRSDSFHNSSPLDGSIGSWGLPGDNPYIWSPTGPTPRSSRHGSSHTPQGPTPRESIGNPPSVANSRRSRTNGSSSVTAAAPAPAPAPVAPHQNPRN